MFSFCASIRRSIFIPSSATGPTPSRTAETLLVRRDGNDVLFLNGFKFDKNTAPHAACSP